MRISFFLLFLVLSLLPLASAEYAYNGPEVSLGSFPNSQCIRLVQLCDNCTYNNITSIVSPNSSVLLQNVIMTGGPTDYNYTVCQNLDNGKYQVNGVGNEGAWTYSFTVGDSSLALFLILGLGAILILAIAFLLGNEYLGFIAGVMFILTGTYSMVNGIATMADDFTRMLSIVLIGLGMMFLVAVGYQIYSSKEDE